ncbi:MAG: cytochrome D1 domain-containing protein [Acidimicrobiales bacterium]
MIGDPGHHGRRPDWDERRPAGKRPPPEVLLRRWALVVSVPVLAVVIILALTRGGSTGRQARDPGGVATTTATPAPTGPDVSVMPGMPPVLDPSNIYSADGPNDLSPAVRGDIPMVYVPNGLSNTVDEIDPNTYKIVRQFPVGALPQHVVPSWDLKTLWVTNDNGNSLTPIDPRTGLPGKPVPVEDPYNMYFTPDGRYAIVVAEALQRLDFRDPHTMAMIHSLPVPCPGVDHMDFSVDGSYLIASCEFGARLLKVDLRDQTVVGTLSLPAGSQPQDVKLSPDGKTFYVADQERNGVWEIDGATMQVLGFLPTGKGAHGLYVSRDSKYLYVTDRDEGAVSVVDLATNKIAATWYIPGGGSPDMGNISADGKVLWLSGRYNSEVYAIDTTTGKLLARIHVGDGPHGLCVWPQPGRYSVGHTGIMR